jgi:hypothetical protein
MTNLFEIRNRQMTCVHCGKEGTLCHPNSDVRAFEFDGSRYYGSPLRQGMGSIIVQGNSCMPCVRKQAQDKVRVLSATYNPRNYDTHPLRVNEMP